MQGYGFRSLEDLFEEGYSGKLAKRGRQQFDADDRYAMLKEWRTQQACCTKEGDKIVIYAEALEQITTKQNELRELARMRLLIMQCGEIFRRFNGLNSSARG